MKLNYEALRAVMNTFQDAPLNPNVDQVIKMTVNCGFSTEDVSYAVKQAIDDHLLDGQIAATLGGGYFFVVSDITPDGHRFIDSITEDTHWNKVKNYLKEEGLPMTVPTITKAIAKVFL